MCGEGWVAEAIAAAVAARSARTGFSADQVLTELARIAFGDRRRLFAWGPGGVALLDSATLDAADAALVTEVSQTTTEAGGTVKVKTADKLGALKLLGEHLGLFVERVEVRLKTTLEVVEEIVDAPPDRPAAPRPG